MINCKLCRIYNRLSIKSLFDGLCPVSGLTLSENSSYECCFFQEDSLSACESDPTGRKPNDPGAKLDQGKNRLGLVMFGFSKALQAVGRVGTYGAQKYSDNGWMQVPDGKERYTDAMLSHLMSEADGEEIDPTTNLYHASQVAWNALARLELMLREKEEKKKGKSS